jgi:hypothetical protein
LNVHHPIRADFNANIYAAIFALAENEFNKRKREADQKRRQSDQWSTMTESKKGRTVAKSESRQKKNLGGDNGTMARERETKGKQPQIERIYILI